MDRDILGARVRERRRQLGKSQAALARELGISASYLNLIEHNKRRIAGALLSRTARALDITLEDLEGAEEQRLSEDLREVAGLEEIRKLGVEAGSIGEFIGRYPGWARALAALARSEQAATARARALGDRLTHDVFLSETVHRMLTRIASIRSASEILVGDASPPAETQAAFQAIIQDEAVALSDVAEALAAYFDRIDEAERSLTPQDEVEALFAANRARFDSLERAAAALHVRLQDPTPAVRWAAAAEIAAAELAEPIAAILDKAREIETAPARARAEAALRAYGAAAILAPNPAFAIAAAANRYDVEALTDGLGLDMPTVCRRLAALPAGEDRPRFGYLQANAAGAIVEMLALPGLAAPRYASACPLLALYTAQQSPGAVVRQRAIFPNGQRFVFVARARAVGAAGFGRPRHYRTDMLAMTEADARHTVYAPDAFTLAEEVGPACRLCPREACAHRIDDPLG